MKKLTLKQENERFAKFVRESDAALKESQKSDRNGNIIIIGFAAIIVGLLIFATTQGTKISELKKEIATQKEEIVWQESKIVKLKTEIDMQDWCQELAYVSGKSFYVSLGACRLKGNDQIRLNRISEIEDSVRHYQLGSKK